ncbi:hypothetical protein EYF80_036667 [Liparis tanakae]|uniref:Uncharacterized protein n=1 Tax=Liparis tanakae TaxID=230148 RepID=A0A4Z2GHY1_9TELE|nr:hypothetical protein EYF80_036667 [Liparis tanakae]
MWQRSGRRASTWVSRTRISSASSIHCPNKSQWRETEGNGCGKKEEEEEEEEEEIRMYDCLIYVMEKERAGGRERSERVETEQNRLSTRHHFIVSSLSAKMSPQAAVSQRVIGTDRFRFPPRWPAVRADGTEHRNALEEETDSLPNELLDNEELQLHLLSCFPVVLLG